MKIACDTLMTSVGYIAKDGLFKQIKENLDVQVYNIGDSNQVHNVMFAICDAYELARAI